MDANGNLLAMALGDSKPIVMEVDLTDGTVTKFTSFAKLGGSDKSMPLFYTFNGVYHDVKDIDDGKGYYYVSFFQDDNLQVFRIQRDTKRIMWNYQYYYQTPSGQESLKYNTLFTPGFIHQDPSDRSRMYLIGRFA